MLNVDKGESNMGGAWGPDIMHTQGELDKEKATVQGLAALHQWMSYHTPLPDASRWTITIIHCRI